MCAKLPCAPNNLVVIIHNSQEKFDLERTKINKTKIRKVFSFFLFGPFKVRKVCVDRYKLHTGKEWRPWAQ